MMLNPKTLEAMRVLEERILHSLLTERHGRVEDPYYAAANEHADEGIALAARDLVDAINAGSPQDWPVDWACGEVGTGWPNGTAGDPVHTEPCRLRPDHDGDHDWAIREDAAEAAQLRAELRRLQPVVEAAKHTVAAWRALDVVDLGEREGLLVNVVGELPAEVAPNGCDDCSVEPGERHRYFHCTGNHRVLLRSEVRAT
ncbi:hypothetical protein JNW88_00220 [Micromonospora sp. ATA32]|nr:hypothetical protein [Micromonospora sp. ATA32]